jgi:hypothetical protein
MWPWARWILRKENWIEDNAALRWPRHAYEFVVFDVAEAAYVLGIVSSIASRPSPPSGVGCVNAHGVQRTSAPIEAKAGDRISECRAEQIT